MFYPGENGHLKQYHRKQRAYGDYLPVYAPSGYVVPFQIIVPEEMTGIENVVMRNLETGQTYNVKTQMEFGGNLFLGGVLAGTNYKHVVYRGLNPINVPKGIYDMVVILTDGSFGQHHWVSEVINVCNNQGFISMSWWSGKDEFQLPGKLFRYFLAEQFRFKAYFKTELGKPIYTYQDTIQTKNGYNFPEQILSVKQYQFEIFGGEPFFDGLRIMRLFDYISLDTKNEIIKVYDVEPTVEWEENGYVGIGTFVINTGNVVNSIGKGRIIQKDFNQDFNIDFG